jgi:hypothetical protein
VQLGLLVQLGAKDQLEKLVQQAIQAQQAQQELQALLVTLEQLEILDHKAILGQQDLLVFRVQQSILVLQVPLEIQGQQDKLVPLGLWVFQDAVDFQASVDFQDAVGILEQVEHKESPALVVIVGLAASVAFQD